MDPVEHAHKMIAHIARKRIVKTYQTSVCDADLRAFQGQYMPEDLPSFKWIGHGGGGEIVTVGPGVREFKPGGKKSNRSRLFGYTSEND